MSRRQTFEEILEIIAGSGLEVDISALALNDDPFWEAGIDSMALLRMVGDIERRFGIELDDADTLTAYSFERLVDLVRERTGATSPEPATGVVPGERVNFLDVVRRHVAENPAAEIRYRARNHDDVVLTHGRMLEHAATLAGHLPPPGSERPQVVLIAAMNPLTTVLAFVAALQAQSLPLVLPHPKALGGVEGYLERVSALAGRFGGDAVGALEPGLLPDGRWPGGVTVVELPADPAAAPAPASATAAGPSRPNRSRAGDDPAFLQMTSASTGDGKIIAISHANICANLDSMITRLGFTPEDRTVSWLPLYHDMGLIGGVLFALYRGFSTTLMRSTDFIKDPAGWLRTVSETRATFTGAPNFAIDYAAFAVPESELAQLDLSCVRRFGLAAEPIQRGAVQRFLNRFGPAGFRPEAMVPGLGMAESTLSTTFRPGLPPRYLVVEAGGALVGEKVAVLGEGIATHPERPGPAVEGGVAVFSLGTPMIGLDVDLRDEAGDVIEQECVLGEIAVRGTSVAAYYDPAAGRPVPFENGLLMSGDLGFVQAGELFVLERRKNVIIRHGANYLASLLEQRVAEILAIPPHGVLIMESDVLDPRSPITVVLENAQELPEPTRHQVRALRDLELPVDVLVYARSFAIPRTTSGKKRYHVCRQQLSDAELDVVRTTDLRRAGKEQR
jgi:fatty-acyl-CoA synthase